MLKSSKIEKKIYEYEVGRLINDIAYIEYNDLSALYNFKTNKIVKKIGKNKILERHGRFFYEKIKDIYTDRKYGTISIYDTLNKQLLIDEWPIIEDFPRKYDSDYGVVIIKSPINGKLYILDNLIYQSAEKLFNMAFDSVEYLGSEGGKYYYNVSANNKKGIYQAKAGLIEPIEYDEIECLEGRTKRYIVYTKNGKKFFEDMLYNEKINVLFDSIKIEKDEEKLYGYCHNGKETKTYIYDISFKPKLIGIAERKVIHYYKFDNIFSTEENKKYGIISKEKEGKVTELLAPEYDEIIRNKHNYVLKKDGKKGLLVISKPEYVFFSPIYDDIGWIALRYYDYFTLYTGDYCDIVKTCCCRHTKLVATNCQIQDYYHGLGIIIKKDNKFGFISNDIMIPNEYDNISFVEKYNLLLEKDNKKGLIHISNKTIIPVECNDIKFVLKDIKVHKILFLAIQKDNKYKLAKINNTKNLNLNYNIYLDTNLYNSIDFFEDLIVCTDSTKTYIYNYYEELVTIFNAVVKVIPYDLSTNFFKRYLYIINGIYYSYIQGRLEKALIHEEYKYITTYESSKNLFEVETDNENMHNSFCEFIDSQDDNQAELELIKLSEEKNYRNKKYPNLKLKRTLK